MRLQAVDADIDLNGELLFSLSAPSPLFYVEPRSGWVRSLRRLPIGRHVAQVQVEDRASRLFFDRRDAEAPFFRNAVNLSVVVTRASERRPPKLAAQPLPLRHYFAGLQPAAILTLSDAADRDVSVALSGEVEARGDTQLEALNARRFLLSIARVGASPPPPISLIVRDRSAPADAPPFTAENIPLTLDSAARRVWFGEAAAAASDETTPRLRFTINESAPVDTIVHQIVVHTSFAEDAPLVK